MKINYLQNPSKIPLAYLTDSKREFMLTEDLEIQLSDRRLLLIPKGYVTDLSSKPQWIWSIFPPFDKRLIATIIHDFLWDEKLKEIAHFETNIYKAFKFSNDEFYKWNKAISPNKKFLNKIEYWFLMNFGMKYYTKQKMIKE